MLKSPLAKTYFLSTLFISVMLSVVFTLVDFVRLYEGGKHELQQIHRSLLRSYQEPVSWALWVIDTQQLKAQLNGLVAVQGVSYASVSSAELGLFLEAGNRRDEKHTSTESMIYRWQDGESLVLGVLSVSGSLDVVYQNTVNLVLDRLLINVLQAVPAVLISFYIFQLLVVGRLDKAVRYIGSDGGLLNLGAPLKLGFNPSWHRYDELDKFAEALNLLRIEAASLGGMFNAAPEAILTLDKAARIVRANPAALTLFDQGLAQVKGRALDTLISLEALSGSEAELGSLSRVIAKASFPYHLSPRELEVRLLDGRRVWLLFSGAAIVEQDRSVSGWILILRDISKEKQLETMVSRGEKFKTVGKMASGIAHDFNNSLAGIVSAAELLSDHPAIAKDPRLSKYINVINKSSGRASELIEKLLAFSRDTKPTYKPVSMRELCNDVVDMMLSTLPQGVSIALEDHCRYDGVFGHKAELQHCLMNLCINASKAMSGSGRIVLRLSTTQASAHPELPQGLFDPELELIYLVVSDTGCGIAAENLSKVFDPFYTTRAHNGGTGLGLATVFNTINEHNGYITVKSTEGVGTQFCLWLPLCEEDVVNDELPDSLTLLKPGTVLLVEDDPVVCLSTKEQLEKLGLQVTTAANGREALAYFACERDRIDLIIADFDMPVMNGMEMLESLRLQAEDFPVIVYSGYLDSLVVERLQQKGVSVCLTKPLRSMALADAICHAVPRLCARSNP